ncbi:MAG: hypothetical protein Q8830_02775 [Candidatus Phytoplasma australasiaticum]|nr:hypothetical protein [Candidatus Phytoplasma australasiaticum]
MAIYHINYANSQRELDDKWQPGQKINIITGNLFINKNISKEQGILLIDKFIHVSE